MAVGGAVLQLVRVVVQVQKVDGLQFGNVDDGLFVTATVGRTLEHVHPEMSWAGQSGTHPVLFRARWSPPYRDGTRPI